MFGNNQTGMSMMIKALLPSLGIDPETFGKKLVELELLLKNTLTDVHGKVTSVESRLARIETMLIVLAHQSEQKAGTVIPAGETWSEHSAATPLALEVAK